MGLVVKQELAAALRDPGEGGPGENYQTGRHRHILINVPKGPFRMKEKPRRRTPAQSLAPAGYVTYEDIETTR
jgi:hypothetical protein